MKKVIRYNKSKTYLLPLLSEQVNLDIRYAKDLINTYIFDNNNKYKDCIFILHRVTISSKEFTLYENKLLNSDLFIDLIDIDSQHSVYIFKFPEDYLYEYNKFKQGKYSEFGEDAKDLILSYWTSIHRNNISAVNFLLKLKQILHKDDKLRLQMQKDLKVNIPKDAELTDVMEKEYETINLSEYNTLVIK